jgi:hypothetical protein
VGRLLSVALPPVSGKPATPSGQSNIRPFLTSLMIKLHPQDVRAHASHCENSDTARCKAFAILKQRGWSVEGYERRRVGWVMEDSG